MHFLHFIVYAHRNKLLKVKSWLLSSHFFSSCRAMVLMASVADRSLRGAQPAQLSV